jgi:cyclic pyranopterin phosphate synthase
LDYIKLAKKTGFKEISMITNGRMLAYKKFARKLLEAGLTDITISIHGSNSNIHDLLTRVSGSFNQTIQGIRNISSFRKELDFNLAINITLTKPNLPYFEDILDLLIPFKADCINFNLVEPRGNALKHFGSIVPEYSYAAKKVCNALKHFYLNKKSNTDTRISISGIPFCLIDEEFRKNISKQTNYIYNIANALKKKLDFRKETMINSHLERKTKAVYCKQCKYFCCCEGIWKEYAKKRGFEEFKPILE